MEIRSIDSIGSLSAPSLITPLTPQERADQQKLIQAVQAVNQGQVFGEDSEVRFVFDRYTKKPVLRVVDKNTDEVIRQVPPEYVLRLAENAGE